VVDMHRLWEDEGKLVKDAWRLRSASLRLSINELLAEPMITFAALLHSERRLR